MVGSRLLRRTAGIIAAKEAVIWASRSATVLRQCPWPQHHGQNRQSAQWWNGIAVDQFRHGLFANTFRGAPARVAGDARDPSASAADEGRILRAVTNTYPTITSVAVKDALDVVNRLVGQLATAIRAAAAVALIASVLVSPAHLRLAPRPHA